MKGSSIFDIKSVPPSLGGGEISPWRPVYRLQPTLPLGCNITILATKMLRVESMIPLGWTHQEFHQTGLSPKSKWRLYYEVARYSTYINLSHVITLFCWCSLVHIDHTIHQLDVFWDALGSLTDTLPAAVTRISSSAFWTSSWTHERKRFKGP